MDSAREVTFYVLEEASSPARLRFVCRITEKAYRAGQRVLIWHTDAAELAALDDLLWTFGDDRSFIPHDAMTAGGTPDAPVLLASGAIPAGDVEVLINLAPEVPQAATRAARVVEIIDGEPERRAAGRARFKAYRDLGWSLVSHNVRG
jgi:DNA polymerase III subunit chi